MLDVDLEFSKNTLYVFMKGVGNKKGIKNLKRKMFNILKQYDIRDIVINMSELSSYDSLTLYEFLDEYDNKYGGNLEVIE